MKDPNEEQDQGSIPNDQPTQNQKTEFDKKIQDFQSSDKPASALFNDPPPQKQKGKKSKFAFKKKKQYVIAEDLALEQIELLFDRYRIDIEKTAEKDPEQAESIESAAEIVLEAVRLAELEIYIDDNDGKLKAKQHVQHRSAQGKVKELIYAEIEGNDQSAMPTGKKINEYSRMHGLLGSMCELPQGASYVKSLRSSDGKTAVALSILFLV